MPPARLLSLTRLVGRAGRTLTGVDRVELAYAEGLAARPEPLWGLVRTALGWLLLDRDGVAAVAAAARSGAWGRADLAARLSRRLTPDQRRGQTLARRHAVARTAPWGLSRLLRRLPKGTEGLLVGHADLSARALGAMRRLGPVAVLVHDAIPLDLPSFQRPGTVAAFAAKLGRVGALADLVVAPSEVARADVARHLAALGRVPPTLAAPLGVPVPRPDPDALPPAARALLASGAPYFVALGTIEPRKNHALLLDLWAAWPEAPPLLILGARGWLNEGVFARLDARPRAVREFAGLPDGAVAALLAGARALLMPSHAEGFGLPAVEAALLGTPVVCGTLPIWRETLGGLTIPCDTAAPTEWLGALKSLAGQGGGGLGEGGGVVPGRRRAPPAPTWEAHLNLVLSRLAECDRTA